MKFTKHIMHESFIRKYSVVPRNLFDVVLFHGLVPQLWAWFKELRRTGTGFMDSVNSEKNLDIPLISNYVISKYCVSSFSIEKTSIWRGTLGW